MKITDMKIYVVDADWRDWVFIKLFTDQGLTGVGEASLSGRGLAIVCALARDWGHYGGPLGRTVWFDLDTPA